MRLNTFLSACESNNLHWIGDGDCDDATNTQGCNFDGGDCCGPNTDTQYCTVCACLGEPYYTKAAPGPFCSCSDDISIDCEYKNAVQHWN